MARYFAGVSGDIVSIPGPSLAAGSPVSISFWNLVLTGAITAGASAFTFGNSDSPNRCQSHCPYSDGAAYFDYSTYGILGSTSYAPYLDKWTHVALISAGSGGGERAMYLNGVKTATTTSSTTPTSTLSGLQIGQWSGTSYYHKGAIEHFAVWNSVLTASEILQLYAWSALPTSIQAGNLIGYWPMNQGQSPEPDLSSGAHNGTVTGTTFVAGPTPPIVLPASKILWHPLKPTVRAA